MAPEVFFRQYNRMQGWERRALQLARGSVLDIGAGAGCHSLILQQRGLDVVAVESSVSASEVMRLRGVERVIHSRIEDIKGIPFDTILLLMNGIGMCGHEAETLGLLRHCRKLLAKNGQILGDSTDVLYAQMNTLGSFSGSHYYGRAEFVIEYRGVKSKPFKWLYLDPSLLSELADKAGLQAEIVYRGEGFHYLARLTHS